MIFRGAQILQPVFLRCFQTHISDTRLFEVSTSCRRSSISLHLDGATRGRNAVDRTICMQVLYGRGLNDTSSRLQLSHPTTAANRLKPFLKGFITQHATGRA